MKCRKLYPCFLVIVVALLDHYRAYAGGDLTDSLQIELQAAASDSIKGLIYLKYAKRVSLSDPVKNFEYLTKGLELGASVGQVVRAQLLMELGNYQRLTGDYSNAVQNLLTALSVFENHKYIPAEEQEKRAHLQKTATCYNNLAIAYFLSGKPEEAENALNEALSLYEQLGDESSKATVLNNIGEVYQKRGDPETALRYYQQAYDIALKSKDLHMQSVVMNNFGDTNYNTGNYAKAVVFQARALRMAAKLADVEGIAYSYLGLAKAYRKLFNYDSALYCARQGLQIAKANNINYLIKEGLQTLKDIYFEQGKFKQSALYADSLIFLTDTIYTQDKNRLITQSQLRYELGRQQSRIELLEKENIIQQQKLLNAELNRKIIYVIIASTLVVISMLLYFLRQRQINNEKLAYQNEMLDAKNKELKTLNDTKDKLFSIIAHDLRSPLSALKNVLDLTDFNLLSPADFAQTAAEIRKNLQNILYTLNNLLEWSYLQIKSGDSIKPEINNLSELIRETVNFYEEVARQKQISIITRVQDSVSAKADKNHLRFVLRNLLNNAIKFSYPRSEILIDAVELSDNKTEITVKDFGKGIEESVLRQLFSPLVRSTEGTAGEQGTGLGLLLCKEFVERNGGAISVESTPGKGTAFKVTLPRR